MTDSLEISEQWVNREDSIGRNDRASRLHWLVKQFPALEYSVFTGGLMSKYLFDEARYCFIYGQFLASIVLAMSYIEHTLAAIYYSEGISDLERANVSRLLDEALSDNLISIAEYRLLNKARKIRNPIMHFRRPGFEDTIEYRAFTVLGELPYKIIEQDAEQVIHSMLSLHARTSI